MPTLQLMYFNGRGRAEVARLIMAYGEIPYEDVRYEREQWPAVKSKMPFGQLPVLKVDDMMICQSMAIYRYLGKLCGIAGNNELEEAKIDMIADCSEDIVKPLIDIFNDKSETGKVMKRESYISQQFPAVLSKLEALLKLNHSGNGYFVGDKMSWADIKFYHDVTAPKLMGIIVRVDTKYPKLGQLRDRIQACPNITKWLEKRPLTAN